jgi:hypothetical protein
MNPKPFDHQLLSDDHSSFFKPQRLFDQGPGIPAIDLGMYPPQPSCFGLTQRANRDH